MMHIDNGIVGGEKLYVKAMQSYIRIKALERLGWTFLQVVRLGPQGKTFSIVIGMKIMWY